MATIVQNTNRVESLINDLFLKGSIMIETESKKTNNSLRNKVLTELAKQGIKNIHCILNRNVIELT